MSESFKLEPCEDAVRRPTLMQMYQQVCKGIRCVGCKFYVDDVSDCKLEKFIHQLPSVTPKQKTGKWIPQNLNKSNGMISTAVYYYPKCSVCGANANYTNFCPNCGAKMEE